MSTNRNIEQHPSKKDLQHDVFSQPYTNPSKIIEGKIKP